MPKTTRDKPVRCAIYVSEKELERLWEIMQPLGRSPEISVRFSDGTQVDDQTLDVIRNFPNSNMRSITQLTMSNGIDADTSVHIVIGLDSGWPNAPFRYRISGNDRGVSIKSRDLDELVNGCAIWFSFLSHPKWRAMIASFVVILFMISSIILITSREDFSQNIVFLGIPALTLFRFQFYTLLLIFIVALLPRETLNYLFPEISFGIGGGRRLH